MLRTSLFFTLSLLMGQAGWSQEIADYPKVNPSQKVEAHDSATRPGAILESLKLTQEAISDPTSELGKMGETVKKTSRSKKFKDRIDREISKYRISFTVDTLGNILDTDILDGGTYYQYVVEPAFRNNEQIRKDIWVISLRGFKKYIGAGGQIRLTFVRFFGGKNAKKDAAFAPIKWFTETPTDSNGIKTKLKDGQGFRFEVSGDIGLGLWEGVNKADFTGTAHLVYKRAGLFIMDLFRLNARQVRVRFIGMKNKGEIEGGLALKNSSLLSALPSVIRDRLSIGIGGSVRRSFDFFDSPLTLDTMMADYLFNFSTENQLPDDKLKQKDTSEAALEEIYANIKNGSLIPLFLNPSDKINLASELLKKAETAEAISKEDLSKYKQGKIPFAEVRVFNYFRGRFESHLRLGQFYGKLSSIYGGSSLSGALVSHVTAFDENQQPTYFWLFNDYAQHRQRFLFGRNKYSLNHDLDVLTFSDDKKSYGPFSDLVVRTQIEDTEFTKDDMDSFRKVILGSLPTEHQNHKEIHEILKRAEHSNAYISYSLNFGQEAFNAINDVNVYDLEKKLLDYVWNHPERPYMHLPFDASQETSPIGPHEWARERAKDIARIFDRKATQAQRTEAFQVAMRDPIFKSYLVQEFFVRLIPEQKKAEDLIGFNLRFSSREAGTHTVSVGRAKSTRIYNAVAFMRSIINDHSLDLQMASSEDYTGNPIPLPSKQNGVQAPLIQVAPGQN